MLDILGHDLAGHEGLVGGLACLAIAAGLEVDYGVLLFEMRTHSVPEVLAGHSPADGVDDEEGAMAAHTVVEADAGGFKEVVPL